MLRSLIGVALLGLLASCKYPIPCENNLCTGKQGTNSKLPCTSLQKPTGWSCTFNNKATPSSIPSTQADSPSQKDLEISGFTVASESIEGFINDSENNSLSTVIDEVKSSFNNKDRFFKVPEKNLRLPELISSSRLPLLLSELKTEKPINSPSSPPTTAPQSAASSMPSATPRVVVLLTDLMFETTEFGESLKKLLNKDDMAVGISAFQSPFNGKVNGSFAQLQSYDYSGNRPLFLFFIGQHNDVEKFYTSLKKSKGYDVFQIIQTSRTVIFTKNIIRKSSSFENTIEVNFKTASDTPIKDPEKNKPALSISKPKDNSDPREIPEKFVGNQPQLVKNYLKELLIPKNNLTQIDHSFSCYPHNFVPLFQSGYLYESQSKLIISEVQKGKGACHDINSTANPLPKLLDLSMRIEKSFKESFSVKKKSEDDIERDSYLCNYRVILDPKPMETGKVYHLQLKIYPPKPTTPQDKGWELYQVNQCLFEDTCDEEKKNAETKTKDESKKTASTQQSSPEKPTNNLWQHWSITDKQFTKCSQNNQLSYCYKTFNLSTLMGDLLRETIDNAKNNTPIGIFHYYIQKY